MYGYSIVNTYETDEDNWNFSFLNQETFSDILFEMLQQINKLTLASWIVRKDFFFHSAAVIKEICQQNKFG